MPILNCYTTQTNLKPAQWEQLLTSWSQVIAIDPKDISIQVCNDYLPIGEKYVLKVEMFLPTLWSDVAVGEIQLSLLRLVEEHLGIRQTDVFLLTQRIRSGHVIDRGKVAHW